MAVKAATAIKKPYFHLLNLLYNKLVRSIVCGAHVSSFNYVFSALHTTPRYGAVIARAAKQSLHIRQIPSIEKTTKVIHPDVRLNSVGNLVANSIAHNQNLITLLSRIEILL